MNVGDGIAVNSVTVNNSTRLTANITVTERAIAGTRYFSVTNLSPGGGTAALVFTVNHPRPTLTGIAPASGNQSQTLDVVFTGADFFDNVTTANVGSGITVSPSSTVDRDKLNIYKKNFRKSSLQIWIWCQPRRWL
ncbi:MAG: hypothetical protein ACREOI_34455 [bacterium]